MDYYNISGTIRISLSFYNTKQEIDSLVDAIIQAKKCLHKFISYRIFK